MFAVGNILKRAHNYFQDFWKRFSIFNKAQQLQLNRKTETNQKKRRKKPTWALPVLAQPPGSAQPAGAASRRPPRARRTRSAWPAPAATRRPPPASADAWRRLGVPRDPPRPPLVLAHSPPRLPHSLPRCPSAFLAAVRRRRRQSHPLAPSTSQIAPP